MGIAEQQAYHGKQQAEKDDNSKHDLVDAFVTHGKRSSIASLYWSESPRRSIVLRTMS